MEERYRTEYLFAPFCMCLHGKDFLLKSATRDFGTTPSLKWYFEPNIMIV